MSLTKPENEQGHKDDIGQSRSTLPISSALFGIAPSQEDCCQRNGEHQHYQQKIARLFRSLGSVRRHSTWLGPWSDQVEEHWFAVKRRGLNTQGIIRSGPFAGP